MPTKHSSGPIVPKKFAQARWRRPLAHCRTRCRRGKSPIRPMSKLASRVACIMMKLQAEKPGVENQGTKHPCRTLLAARPGQHARPPAMMAREGAPARARPLRARVRARAASTVLDIGLPNASKFGSGVLTPAATVARAGRRRKTDVSAIRRYQGLKGPAPFGHRRPVVRPAGRGGLWAPGRPGARPWRPVAARGGCERRYGYAHEMGVGKRSHFRVSI